MQQESLDGEAIASSTSTPESSSTLPSEDLKWEPLVLTEDKIRELWEKLKDIEVVWDDFSRNDFDGFVSRLLAHDSIFIDIGPSIGLASATAVRPRLDMVLHLVMFDRRLRGREALLKEIIGYFFEKLQLRRVTCVVGTDARTAIKLASRLGFAHEGTMRKAILRNGEYLDAEIFGMLREEL